MNRLLKVILLATPLLCSSGLFSAENDTTRARYFTGGIENLFLGEVVEYDTLLEHAVYFDETDHPFRLYNTLSNFGLAHKQMSFAFDADCGFDLSIPAFKQFLKNRGNTRYFIVDKPLTDLKYTMGLDKEQRLDVTFAETLFKQCQISMNFNTDYAPGIYVNSKSNNTNFDMNLRYASKSDMIGMSGYFFLNKLEMQENGGITDLTDIFNNDYNRNIIHTNLQNAQNVVRSNGFGIGMFIKTPNCKPSVQNDSTHTEIGNLFKLRLSYNLDFQKNKIYFNETSFPSTFYTADSTLYSKTYDSLEIHGLENKISVSNFISKDQKILYSVGLGIGNYKNNGYFDYEAMTSHANDTLEYERYRNQETKTNAFLTGFVRVRPTDKLSVTGNAKFILAGYNSGDAKLNAQMRQHFGKKSLLRVSIDYGFLSPTWFQTEYYSNHFRWQNNFEKTSVLSVNAEAKMNIFAIGINHTGLSNYIYFNQSAEPEQMSGRCSVDELFANIDWTSGRFSVVGFASAQRSNTDKIRVPAASCKIKLAYSIPYANHAAIIQPGITVSYFTKYFADAYMPATRVFHLQDNQEIGNCPFVDFHIAIQIKMANIYLKYINANTLLNQWEHFVSPSYPARDACLYFGVNWRLFN